MGQLNIANEMLIQRRIAKREDGLRNIVARSFDGNVIVLLKIDARVLLGRIIGSAKQLTLDAGVSRACNVFAIAPLAIARATSVATTATASSAVAAVATVSALTRIGIGVKALRTVPATLARTVIPIITLASIEILGVAGSLLVDKIIVVMNKNSRSDSLRCPCAVVQRTICGISGSWADTSVARTREVGAWARCMVGSRTGAAAVRGSLPPHMGRDVGAGAITIDAEAIHV